MADRAGSSSDGDRIGDEKTRASSPSSFVKVKASEDIPMGEMGEMGNDIERQELLQDDNEPAAKAPEPEKGSVKAAVIWMVVNTLATIGIVRYTSQTSLSGLHLLRDT